MGGWLRGALRSIGHCESGEEYVGEGVNLEEGVGLFCEAAPLEDVKGGHFILGELSDLWCKGAE